jgi:hypothetical protein|tara:strand:+ start:408 stop:1004 length:597 start_codon:yes stop_codon:yes gene_type:complete
MPDLTSYQSVHTSLFVRLQIDEYRTTSGGAYSQQVLRFSDHFEDYTYNTELYQNVGNFLSISASKSELRASNNEVSVTLSGIPDASIAEIIHSKIKGAPIDIYRGFFDTSTEALIGSLYGRFRGYVNNYSLEEDYDVDSRSATNLIILECASTSSVFDNKVVGRRTNPQSNKLYYPNDTSMDRVPNLQDQTFNFGAPS